MSTFVNPIAPAPHADPWVLYHEGAYYYCFSRGGNSLCVAKAGRLCDIGRAEPVCVYTAPEGCIPKAIGLPNSTASAASG